MVEAHIPTYILDHFRSQVSSS